MNILIKKHLPLLHSDDNLKILFRTETFNVVCRKNTNLKELLTPSLFPTLRREKYSCVASCNTCDICKNYMVFSSTFVFTGKKYQNRGNFKCQYVGPATFFKQRFGIPKSDIKTKKDCMVSALPSPSFPIIMGALHLRICLNFLLHLWGDKPLWGSLNYMGE